MCIIIISSLRGTKLNYSENIFKKLMDEKKQLKSFISKNEKGQKISLSKEQNLFG